MAALEQMGEPAVTPLLAMLNSEDASERRNAAQALGWIGSASATEGLMGALKKDKVGTVRAQAAWALGEIGDPAGRRALERAQLHDATVEVQTAAGWALSQVPVETATMAGWATRWAPALDRFEPMRWLVLALSLVGGAGLMMSTRPWATAPLRLRQRTR